MRVELITHTPNPSEVVSTAARLCYSSVGIEEIAEHTVNSDNKNYIEMLMGMGHESPFEHVSFTFGIEGISRACSHQLVRHRIASYSQKSQRYVDESGFCIILPDSVKNNSKALEVYTDIINRLDYAYERLIQLGIPKEDARFVLPNACETKIIVTTNARSLFNFFKHRCCNRAQWEIRAVAEEMLRLCIEAAPDIFSHADPSCVTDGKCPEGKMTCGKMKEMREKYEQKTVYTED